VTNLVRDQPAEERLLFLADFDLGGVLGVERGDEVDDPVVEPSGDLVAVEPVFALAQRGAAGADVDGLGERGGVRLLFGLFGGDITLPTPYIPMRAMTIQGSYTGSLPELKELIALLRSTPMPYMPVEVRPLDSVNASLRDLKDGNVIGRVVLAPN